MSTLLSVVAIERGTYAVTATLTDENGAPATPTSLVWTLTDLYGAVVNSREDVVVSPLASTITIVLSGADLAVSNPANVRRKVSFVGAYNSSLGSGLPLVAEVQFDIEEVAGVP